MLSDINEKIIADENGYDIFEPTVALEINGKNVLETVGIEEVKIVVIMHFRERAIRETVNLVEGQKRECNYWLLGTGFGFLVERKTDRVAVTLKVDGAWGPSQGTASAQTVQVGMVSLREWVESIVSLETVEQVVSTFEP